MTATGLLTFHPGSHDDLDEVMAIMTSAFDPAFGEAWTRPQVAGLLGMTGVWLTLARLDERPAGFALSRQAADEVELLLLAVSPAYQRRGVGTGLLAAERAAAEVRGARTLHLEMRAGNPAEALYRAAGFLICGRRPGYYSARMGSLDALTFSLALIPPVV